MFKIAALVTLFVTFTLAAPNSDGRIVGGRDAVRRQAPFSVSVRNTGTDFHVGGGAMISDRWIVTCASILQGRADTSFDVALGIVQLSQSSVSGSVIRRSAEIVPHPGFILSSMINDIGLIRLGGVGSVSFSTFIMPIFFEATRWDSPATSVLSGWGSQSSLGPVGDAMQILLTETMTNEECEQILGRTLTRDVVCTRNNDGSGLCANDRGSPLVAGLQLIGIASSSEACGTTRPNIYTRLSSYRTWIGSITGI